MSGPPPKTPDRRQRRAARTTTGRRGGLVALEGGQDPPPSAPAGLLKPARQRWAAFWTSKVADAVDRTSDLPALVRWIQATDEYDRVAKVVKRSRLVKGSMGQPVANPLLGYLAQLDSQIAKAEAAFGMTPIARLRLGIALGEAARSLDELNRALDDDGDDDEQAATDPRQRVVESTARPATTDARAQGVPLDRAVPGPRRG
jgi:P27 family predicted phage terminase small subunit